MTEPDRVEPRRRLLWNGLRWGLALLIIAVLLRMVKPADFVHALSGVPLYPYLAIAGAYLLISFFADSGYWWMFLRLFGIHRPYDEMLAVRGYTYLLMVINYGFSVGGIGVYLRNRAGVPALRSGALMLLFMVSEWLCLAALTLLGLRLVGDGRLPGLALFCAVFVAATLALILLLKSPWISTRAARVGVPGVLHDTPLRVWLSVVVLRAPYLGLMIVYHAVALPLFGVSAPPEVVAAFVPALLFIAGLPLTPAGLGTAQAAMVYAFRDYGAPENILAMSLATMVLVTFGRLPIGLWYAWRRPAILG